MTWTWTLRCLTLQCLPQSPSSQFSHVFHFHPARVEYLSPAWRGPVRARRTLPASRGPVPSSVLPRSTPSRPTRSSGETHHPRLATRSTASLRASSSGSRWRSRSCSGRPAWPSLPAGRCSSVRPGPRNRRVRPPRSSERSRSSSGRGPTTTRPCSGRHYAQFDVSKSGKMMRTSAYLSVVSLHT